MDGLPQTMELEQAPASREAVWQRTLKAPIDCVGVGVHSGARVQMTIHPAGPDSGIVFHRTDLDRTLPARFDNVVDTRLCTVLGVPGDPTLRVGTVEHLMAALAAKGIDNALVTLDGPEVPILDGSAAPILFLLDCAGAVEQAVPRRGIEILQPVRVSDGAAFAELRPNRFGPCGLGMAMSIDFAAAAIGRQAYELQLSEASFRHELAGARTFAMAEEVEQLRAMGLARGGSLDNALVVEGARVLNPGGLRMEGEFVRHKLLDAVGDLALAGQPLHGRFVAHRSGHALNNKLLRALFADRSAWRPLPAPPALAAA
ncbi:MAG: UDP-3-O-[3-hydroxymyristoyl] N-acetylglucosamine deacetylase [Rhodospirillales bacterium 69-11]|nr:UDP-3-O-acyl-N-acetylglucosamine deacetylase [Rhodospirillales bacterium]OJW22287.1 MAG: UDP-3-O-[3-hydroxymyristoyl] N-acetylglucosamine deacetylase [Rhodospirillales bacterium 69-11]